MRICSYCGEKKRNSDFYKRETGTLRANCKPCHNDQKRSSLKMKKKRDELYK